MSDNRSGSPSSRPGNGPTSTGASTAGLKLSPVQVAASALASVSAAVVASLFGVAGTIIGAAVVSVVATVASAVYAASIRRAHVQVRQLQSGTLHAAAQARQAAGQVGAMRHRRLGQLPEAEADRPVAGPGSSDPKNAAAAGRRRMVRWPAAVGVVAAFAVAMGVVTLIEAITGTTLAHSLGGSKTGGFTITGGSSRRTPRTTTPTTPASTTTTTRPSPTTTPTTPASTTTTNAPSAPSTSLGGATSTTS
jgi:hypothetical protein